MSITRGEPADVGLVWFRRDLRLRDNPAWAAATAAHKHVVALYVLDDVALRHAGAHRRRQHIAELHALDASLRAHGGRLLVRRGSPASVVAATAERSAAAALYFNADVSPYARRRDGAVAAATATDIAVHVSWGNLVLPPGSVLAGAGHVHKVFGAYHRAWRSTPIQPWPEPGAALIAADEGDGLPRPDATPPRAPGEDGANELLTRFLDDVDHYLDRRNDLAHSATSELSVALHFGTISARHLIDVVGSDTDGRAAFVRQLAWRDWYAHLLHEQPTMIQQSLRSELDCIDWSNDPRDIAAWKAGCTGFPLVDAAMRELAATGAMHNRARMVTASFLVKDLLVHWREGERHFRQHLVDADVAQNAGNWQWVAGTGPDAAPFFRVFNPVTQSRTHDPHGTYLRRWIPELAGLDDTAIHAPWEAAPLDLAAAGVVLGDTYPHPLVDHADARRRALDAYAGSRA